MKKLVLFLMFMFPGLSVAAEVVEKVVAVVNNQAVTLSDLKNFEADLNDNALVDELLARGKSIDDLKKDPKARLDYLIDEKVISSLIQKKGLAVTSDRIEKELQNMAARNNLTRDQLVLALKEQGVALSKYQDFLKSRIERQALIEQEVSSKIRITDEEVLSLYARKNKEKDKSVHEYSLSHILFLPEQGDAEKALERAKKALAQLNNKSASFNELAKKHSEDPNFSEGGKLGTFRSGEFLPEIEEAVSKLDEGQITSIIRSRAGFHIVRLDDKKLIPNPEFNKQKEVLRAQLFQEALQSYLTSWLEQQRSEAFVRIN